MLTEGPQEGAEVRVLAALLLWVQDCAPQHPVPVKTQIPRLSYHHPCLGLITRSQRIPGTGMVENQRTSRIEQISWVLVSYF